MVNWPNLIDQPNNNRDSDNLPLSPSAQTWHMRTFLDARDNSVTYWSFYNWPEFRGKQKLTILELMCAHCGLDPEKVKRNAFSWDIQKSRNLNYHPNTYTLRIRHETFWDILRDL